MSGGQLLLAHRSDELEGRYNQRCRTRHLVVPHRGWVIFEEERVEVQNDGVVKVQVRVVPELLDVARLSVGAPLQLFLQIEAILLEKFLNGMPRPCPLLRRLQQVECLDVLADTCSRDREWGIWAACPGPQRLCRPRSWCRGSHWNPCVSGRQVQGLPRGRRGWACGGLSESPCQRVGPVEGSDHQEQERVLLSTLERSAGTAGTVCTIRLKYGDSDWAQRLSSCIADPSDRIYSRRLTQQEGWQIAGKMKETRCDDRPKDGGVGRPQRRNNPCSMSQDQGRKELTWLQHGAPELVRW